MQCPVDKRSLRSVEEADSHIVVDECDVCKGVWFDAGELTNAIDHYKDRLTPKNGKDMLTQGDIGQYHQPTTLECPEDATKMEEYAYAGDSRVFIHHCLSCRGFWFDGGELEAIKDYLRPNPLSDAMGATIIAEKQNFEHFKDNMAEVVGDIAFISQPYLLAALILRKVVRRMIDRNSGLSPKG